MKIEEATVGFELEFNGVSVSRAQEYLDQFGLIHEDGSVPDGFELSSHVRTGRDFLSPSVAPDLANLYYNLDKLRVSEDCFYGAGQHIHVGKPFFQTASILAINKFFLAYQDYLQLIGGRTLTPYCPNILNIYANPNGELLPISGLRDVNIYHKYATINVSRLDTVEFRFFKTTKNYDVFLKNMQFALAISDFSVAQNLKHDLIKKGDNGPLNDFHDYVAGNEKDLKHLAKFLRGEGYLPALPKIYELEVPEKEAVQFYKIADKIPRVIEVGPNVVKVDDFFKAFKGKGTFNNLGLFNFINKLTDTIKYSGAAYIKLPTIKTAVDKVGDSDMMEF